MSSLRIALLAAVALLPSAARAGNAAEPRVPPAFLGGDCLEILHPGDPPLHLTIGIPLEETIATDDEPPDSRTFQFFAACREPFPAEDFPPWIDAADLDAAQAANPAILTPDASLVLPTSTWSGCLIPVTGRDPRMPITCEGTAAGVEIAADLLPPGNHSLWGYTYEPDKNVWTPRTGVLRVVGADGEDALPPAVAFAYPSSAAVASTGAGLTLTGCATGKADTTIELSWATTSDLVAFGEDAWEAFATLDIGEADPGFAVPFVPPPDSDFKVVKFRALAIDGDGGSWTAYTRESVILEPGCGDPADGRELVADLCGVGSGDPEPTDAGAGERAAACDPGAMADDGGGQSTGAASEGSDAGEGTGSAETGESDAGGAGEAPRGCGCASGAPARGVGWLVLLGLGLLARRRA